ILNSPDRAKHKIRTRPRFTVAGAPPPAAFIKRLEQEIGWEFLQIYGLTETAPILTVSAPDFHLAEMGGAEPYQRRSRAGVAAIGVDLQILDDNGQAVPMDDQTVG